DHVIDPYPALAAGATDPAARPGRAPVRHAVGRRDLHRRPRGGGRGLPRSALPLLRLEAGLPRGRHQARGRGPRAADGPTDDRRAVGAAPDLAGGVRRLRAGQPGALPLPGPSGGRRQQRGASALRGRTRGADRPHLPRGQPGPDPRRHPAVAAGRAGLVGDDRGDGARLGRGPLWHDARRAGRGAGALVAGPGRPRL
ncbi:MAG: Transcriptional regulator, AcrR family, partial [uncultured Nocardioides sp.]